MPAMNTTEPLPCRRMDANGNAHGRRSRRSPCMAPDVAALPVARAAWCTRMHSSTASSLTPWKCLRAEVGISMSTGSQITGRAWVPREVGSTPCIGPSSPSSCWSAAAPRNPAAQAYASPHTMCSLTPESATMSTLPDRRPPRQEPAVAAAYPRRWRTGRLRGGGDARRSPAGTTLASRAADRAQESATTWLTTRLAHRSRSASTTSWTSCRGGRHDPEPPRLSPPAASR